MLPPEIHPSYLEKEFIPADTEDSGIAQVCGVGRGIAQVCGAWDSSGLWGVG